MSMNTQKKKKKRMDKLFLYLRELQESRDSERKPLDDHLRLLELREFTRIRTQTNLKTR